MKKDFSVVYKVPGTAREAGSVKTLPLGPCRDITVAANIAHTRLGNSVAILGVCLSALAPALVAEYGKHGKSESGKVQKWDASATA